MDSGDTDKEQDAYDVFRQDTSSLEVVEEHPARTPESTPPKRPKLNLRRIKRQVITILVIMLLASLIALGYFIAKQKPTKEVPPANVTINTQSLDNGTLNQLTSGLDGETKQQLTISADTIFKNSVVIQDSAEVAKKLLVRGNVDVSGTTSLRSSLSVNGPTTIGGSLTVGGLITAGSLNVGSITISSINISGNLSFNGHFVPGGSTPSVRTSTAAGGGNVNIEGNDTSGTITIRTGSNPTAGELAVVTFRSAYSTTPRLQLTPLNNGSSSINYYGTKSSSFFTINSSNTPAANTTYIFDYFITQ